MHTTNLQQLYESTSGSGYPMLRSGGLDFIGAKFYCLPAIADGPALVAEWSEHSGAMCSRV